MKIALVTLNGKTISQHFGRSPYYIIYTVKNNEITGQELRRRGTGHFAEGAQEQHEEHDNSQGHGMGADADRKHASMAQEIADCDVLVAGGMGTGAYNSFTNAGLKVVMTDHADAHEATLAYLKGELPNLVDQRTH